MNKSQQLITIWTSYFNKENVTPISLSKNILIPHIPDKETIYETYETTEPANLVITNAAIYFSGIRWSLSNICKYAVHQLSNTILLIDSNFILTKIVCTSAATAHELILRILSMQNFWYPIATNGSIQRQALLDSAELALHTNFENDNRIPAEIEYSLKYLFSISEYSLKSGQLLLEYYVYSGNFDAFINLAEKLAAHHDTEKLCNLCNEWLSKYKPTKLNFTKAAHVSVTIKSKPLFNILANYWEQHKHSTSSANKLTSYDEFIKGYHSPSDITTEDLESWYRVSGPQLKIIREAFLNSSTISSEKFLLTRDNYGMTGYNYALLLHNKTVIKSIERFSLSDISFINQNDDEISTIDLLLSPFFIAYYTDDKDTFNYLITRSREFIALGKTLTTVRKQMSNLKNYSSKSALPKEAINIYAKIRTQEKYIAQLKATRAPYYELTKAQQTLAMLKVQYQNAIKNGKKEFTKQQKKLYDELKEEEQSIIEEIERIKQYYINKFEEICFKFENSNHNFVNMLLYSYKHPIEFINRGFINPQILISYANIPFYVDANYYSFTKNQQKAHSGSQKQYNQHSKQQKEQSRKQGNAESHSSQQKNSNSKQTNTNTNTKQSEKVNKPYSNNWFSPEAYSDLSVLKHEYRKLIMKYHPDNPNGSAEIFIDIQTERANIIEKLSR